VGLLAGFPKSGELLMKLSAGETIDHSGSEINPSILGAFEVRFVSNFRWAYVAMEKKQTDSRRIRNMPQK
jgi:hypothetical protein